MTEDESVEGHETDIHFLRAVTDMAERIDVVTGEAIYTEKGLKLVDRGTRVDSRMYDRLVMHRLKEPLDTSLVTGNLVDAASLQAHAREQCDQFDLLYRMAQSLGDEARMLAPFKGLPLPQPIAFKLTVMREQRPDLYLHSLRVALVSVYLALKKGWNEQECVSVVAAALLHDVGMLYMEPTWTDPEYRLSGEERKHLVAHSVTAALVVRSAELYSRAVAIAVLEHHERMDGTGYPRGLQGSAISLMGQVLLLAEVVSAFFEKFKDMPGQRLSLMLRMNHKSYPADLVRIILPLLYDEIGHGVPLQPLQAEVAQGIATLDAVLRKWAELSHRFPAQWEALPKARAAAYVDGTLAQLQKQLAEAGSHPSQQLDVLNYLKDDVQGMGELALVNREALWQLQAIVDACARRWPTLNATGSPFDAAVADWCDACGQLALRTGKPPQH